MYFKQLFDPKLAQYSYVIGCQASGEAIVIDPMRDIDQYFELATKEKLSVVAAADTHIHADYVSGLQEMAARGVMVYASDEGDADWKYNWLPGSDYAFHLLKHGDKIHIGNIVLEAVHTPGHTPEHISYLLTDGAAASDPMGMLSGDFVFVGDVGRPDLLETAAGHVGNMEPSARRLYSSLEEFKSLPDYLKVWPAHGAGSACGKALGAVPDSTVGYEKRFSAAIRAASEESEFVKFILDGQPEPPVYFARMKKVNRDGIEVLGTLPQPRHLSPQELEKLINSDQVVVVDTRHVGDFVEAHIPGSILATFNKAFNTIAGSYIDPDKRIILLIEESFVNEAVRDLVRVGLDHVIGFITPDYFDSYFEDGMPVKSLQCIHFPAMEEKRQLEGYKVLDVRKATEFTLSSVPEAINIAHTRIKVRMDELEKEKTYLVHCQAGGRAAAAASLLAREGFQVELVNDNFQVWEKMVNGEVLSA